MAYTIEEDTLPRQNRRAHSKVSNYISHSCDGALRGCWECNGTSSLYCPSVEDGARRKIRTEEHKKVLWPIPGGSMVKVSQPISVRLMYCPLPDTTSIVSRCTSPPCGRAAGHREVGWCFGRRVTGMGQPIPADIGQEVE
ncbi:unnamed protein product [Pleuronectes platessa]|uniref:Uncharacterized protein n=1 Tax=Pleuronectes platessa TaxID=8262 RepID=A0A9N7ULZ1_PLEPL|nr:unnamed protein product [Pleuronectes platessa]